MRRVKIVIIEDMSCFSDALKVVLEDQTIVPCEVHILNPASKD